MSLHNQPVRNACFLPTFENGAILRRCFGEDENMMQVKLYEAVRKARQMPTAESVVVWHDLEELVKVYIDHTH